MTRIVKVEDRPDLVKDIATGALLYVDRKAAKEYKEKKALLNNTKESQMQMEQIKSKLAEIDTLKNDLNEIKSLLKEIVNK